MRFTTDSNAIQAISYPLAIHAKIACLITAMILILSPQSHAADITTGLVAQYNFSGNANNLIDNDVPDGMVHNATLTTDRDGEANSAYFFNGVDSYIEFDNHDAFSVTSPSQGFTIAVWLRPDGTSKDEKGRILFEDEIKDKEKDYVHWMGVGGPDEQEWAGRMYSADNTDDPYRENRISFYVFNPDGDLGTGSYAQETIVKDQWLFFVAVVRTEDDTKDITWYRHAMGDSGFTSDNDSFDPAKPLSEVPNPVTPMNKDQPFRLGTRQFDSHFAGAIDDIRIYNRALSPDDVAALIPEPTSAALLILTTPILLRKRSKR